MNRLIFLSAGLLFACFAYSQKLVRYDLLVSDTVVNLAGKEQQAIAINGQIPAPTLYFSEGDTAEIHVHNSMHHETSIHWHGLLLPNEQDGVPYLTTQAIMPHQTFVYRFTIRQTGTYWYHSHTMLQEQIGLYGAIIIYDRQQRPDREEVLLLSDWSSESPGQIERSLHFGTDWYMVKKNAVQSYGEAVLREQWPAKLENEFKRMHAMDVSDVYYERFLMNGLPLLEKPPYSAGDTVRLRVINGSSSTYFWLNYSGGRITVVASDGMEVEPVEVDRLIIGVSETYDLLITLPEANTVYAFTATAEDRSGAAILLLGQGEPLAPDPLPRLDYFEGLKMMNAMTTPSGKLHDMDMNMSLQQMDMNAVMYPEITAMQGSDSGGHHHEHSSENKQEPPVTLNYTMLRSRVATNLPEAPLRTLHFELTGNMNRYVWTLDNKTVSESDLIPIKAGENIRIILTNNSMMRHPIHLHGHFFRVVNGQGAYAPLKNVLDILPMETDTIEFHASEGYGDWYFHCHILYHMMAGMGRIFHYENASAEVPRIQGSVQSLKKVYRDDRRFYFGAEIGLESNGSDGEITFMNTRWKLSGEWRVGLNGRSGYETESHFGRYLDNNQWLFLYGGWDWRYREELDGEKNIFLQYNTKNKRGVAHFGLQYMLPMLIMVDLSVDHTGYFRLQLKRDDLPVTKRLRMWGMFNSDLEYRFGARYIISKYLSASAHYDSDMGGGLGVTFTY